MRASWHPERGYVVLSFWQAEVCTATYRLPVAEATRLVHILVEALGESLADPESTVVDHPSTPRRIPGIRNVVGSAKGSLRLLLSRVTTKIRGWLAHPASSL